MCALTNLLELGLENEARRDELLVQGLGLEVALLRLAHRVREGADAGGHLASSSGRAGLAVLAAEAAVVRRRLAG